MYCITIYIINHHHHQCSSWRQLSSNECDTTSGTLLSTMNAYAQTLVNFKNLRHVVTSISQYHASFTHSLRVHETFVPGHHIVNPVSGGILTRVVKRPGGQYTIMDPPYGNVTPLFLVYLALSSHLSLLITSIRQYLGNICNGFKLIIGYCT